MTTFDEVFTIRMDDVLLCIGFASASIFGRSHRRVVPAEALADLFFGIGAASPEHLCQVQSLGRGNKWYIWWQPRPKAAKGLVRAAIAVVAPLELARALDSCFSYVSSRNCF